MKRQMKSRTVADGSVAVSDGRDMPESMHAAHLTQIAELIALKAADSPLSILLLASSFVDRIASAVKPRVA